MSITLQESLRGLFYAPYYAALSLGAFEKEGVEVKFVSAPRPGAAPDGLFNGSVDVGWGGPMRVNELYEKRKDCDLVCFGEAVTRDPFMLVGRQPRPNFRIHVLAAVRIATVSEVPTPWLCLQEDLRRAGIDPDNLNRIDDWTMGETAGALARGDIDVAQLFQPLAEQLIASGAGHLWYAAATRGPCSYTTFYARRSLLDEKRDELLRLVRGLYRTQKWLHAAGIDKIVDAVLPFFPTVAPSLLYAALARYKSLEIWGRNPILPRDGYERLLAGMVSGGFVKGTPYETAVDNSLAEQVVREDPPPL
jgi:NitT/TauT family transport system substrate-binding protein